MYRLAVVFLGLFLFMSIARSVSASDIPVGFHLLDPHELDLALSYKREDVSLYVTVPLSIYDRRAEVWERFFSKAHENNVVPIVRWITVFSDGSWQVPSRKDVVEATVFMKSIRWSGKRIIVLFNEPNHAAEWGGRVDPEGYAELALFAANWLKTETKDYIVLPAGLDGDAPTNATMMESFTYLERMHRAAPELFTVIDAWTSHSYPNPAFSGTVFARGKNSIRGFEAELEKLERMTGRSFEVYITETGWRQNQLTTRRLPGYYREVVSNIWADERIKAVTLFVLKATHGPFKEFSLLDENDRPTTQMRALQMALDGK
jgi:hypothetical protein